ncbi:MAG: transglycosylase domain-containing protein [Clostridia bacterium]|nr:transglycosylase domain-containing protein [Clostridia bacterium]
MAKDPISLIDRVKAWFASRFQRAEAPAAAPKKRKRVRRVLRRVWHAILAVFLIGVITVTVVGCVLVVYVVSTFEPDSYIPILGEMSMDNRSVIYVENDKGEFEPYHNLLGGTSVWVDLDKIPLHMQNAVVAIEDERFRDHEGVDWKRTASAVVNLIANRVFHIGTNEFGGSTITQQLIKVTTQNTDHSIKRKITEILAATAMESGEYTKDEILEGYLNNMPLTGDLVGVGIGARYYFGKELQELTLAECAVLASITNNPSVYDPYLHPENVRQRQQLVLAKMYECRFITKDEYLNALNQELVFKSSTIRQPVQDYYVDLVVEDVIADLMEEYGYTYNYANNMVYYGGLNIYSAEDPEVQAKVEAVFADEKNYPAIRKDDEENPQAAFFAVDYTGRVVATIGGRGEKDANRVFNRSTQALRSPGSSMKPITSYGPAIALDLAHYSSMVRDAPITLPNGKKWPHNYEMKSTPDNGNVLLGVALQKSLNTVAARLVQQLTPQRSYNYATQTFGLTTLVETKAVGGRILTDIDLSPMALGALTDGATARDMASAYGVFGSGGYYNDPYTYYKVTKGADEDETILLNGGQQSTLVLDEQSAYVMVKLMQRVTTYGTASDISKAWPGWQVFGKTGTSESEKDVYFTGGTAYYSAASWFGYDNNQELKKNQTSYAKSLWNKAMKVLHSDLQIKEFKQPVGVETLKYCTATGQLATDKCPKTDTGYYKSSNKPAVCEKHAGKPIGNGTTTTGGAGATTSATAGTSAAATTDAAATTTGTEAPTTQPTNTTDTTAGEPVGETTGTVAEDNTAATEAGITPEP